jgi:pimeloyl-ACP methyl ester carboxylesterase
LKFRADSRMPRAISRTLQTRCVYRILRLGTALVLLYLVVAAGLYLGQRWLIYLPSRTSETAMLALASDSGLRPWRDPAGAIIGWRSLPAGGERGRHRLLVFHGNAGFAVMRSHFVRGFEAIDNGATWEVTLFEYPHFGARPGALGERAIRSAANEAVAQMWKEDDRPLFLVGESLGSGPACALAGNPAQRVAGLFLITPYRSLAAMAHHRFPMFPTRFILRDRWDNDVELADFHGRVAVLLAADDEVIPVAQGRALFDVAREPKRLWTIPRATHNTLPFAPDAAWWREVSTFLVGSSSRAGR